MGTKNILALASTVGYFGCLILLAYVRIPPENQETIRSMMGTAGNGWLLVLGYFFGSSIGSSHKTALLADKAHDIAK